MKHSLSRTLPGFKMFNAFFSDLKGAFEPTILTEKQKAVFRQAIAALDGSPKEALRPLREDFGLTAKVREARKYEDGRTFVRYEFNRLESNCTWSRPYQLMAAFGQVGDLESYTVQALGFGDGKIDEPFSIRIAPGTLAAQRRAIFYKAVNEEDKVKASKLFAMLALRGHTQSRNNLGFHFHFGMGVPEDYDLAIYWHTLAARAGDAYAMTNLGKIYSTKHSPKWDGPKAIKWFEKATAKGETWAMGELGHCLLCGKCAGKDVARARSLLEKAVAANPDRGDFVEELDRARDEAE